MKRKDIDKPECRKEKAGKGNTDRWKGGTYQKNIR
jgi:hypothetical protein